MVCLDTNAVIALLRRQPSPIRSRFERDDRPVSLSVVVLFELRYGIAKSEQRATSAEKLARFLETPIPVLVFEREDAEEAADIRAHLARAGAPIGPYDVLIAAQARRQGATLVTANTREFSRVPGLAIEDWSAP